MSPKRDVWQKLRDAYDTNCGVRLTADDVTQLVLRDTAVLDLVYPDRDGGLPSKPKKART